MSDVFERMAAGEPIAMRTDPEYIPVAHAEMDRCRSLCFKINTTDPAGAVVAGNPARFIKNVTD